MREKLLAFHKANPGATQGDAAAALGVSRQRISQLCQELGLRFMRATRASNRPIMPKADHWGNTGLARSRSPHFIGAGGEMLVAADLLVRGISVFRSLSATAEFDLLAVFNGRMLRIECRSARYKMNGAPIAQRTDRRKHDGFAMITPDKKID